MKKLDPYKTLDLDRSASAAEVKSAFRKKAMKAHPDRGGSTEAFDKINRANIVLSDPAKRSKYDRTGEIDEDTPDNVISAPLSIIMGFFQQACTEQAEGRGGNPFEHDMIALAKSHFHKTINNLEGQKKKLTKIIASMKRLSERLSRKKGENMLSRSLMVQANMAGANLNMIDQQIEAHRAAIVMVDDYQFKPDTASPTYSAIKTPWFLENKV